MKIRMKVFDHLKIGSWIFQWSDTFNPIRSDQMLIAIPNDQMLILRWSNLFIPIQISNTQKDSCVTIINTLHVICRLLIDPHNDKLPVGLIAQLVDYCTGIPEVVVWIPVQTFLVVAKAALKHSDGQILSYFFLSVPFFKVLKLYAWEESFMKQIKRIRDKELKFLRNTGLWTAGFMFTFNCAPTLVSCVHHEKSLFWCNWEISQAWQIMYNLNLWKWFVWIVWPGKSQNFNQWNFEMCRQ